MVDGGAVCRTAFDWGNKKRLCPKHGTKACCFCDTTQIDVKTSTRLRVPSYASRWITGGSPSASTWFPVQAALRSPFTDRFVPHFHRQGLSETPQMPGTSLRHRFELFHCCGHYTRGRPVCQAPISKCEYPFGYGPETGDGFAGRSRPARVIRNAARGAAGRPCGRGVLGRSVRRPLHDITPFPDDSLFITVPKLDKRASLPLREAGPLVLVIGVLRIPIMTRY